jgi:ribosomal protein S12 methylthiotransferase
VDELCAFLEEFELDRVGVFRYSREEGTEAAAHTAQIAETVKRRRWERVMAAQARVAARRSRAQIGREVDVLIEGEGERPGTLVGRTRDQAPEIDGQITVLGEAAHGDLVRVRVTDAAVYDLSGVILRQPTVDLG